MELKQILYSKKPREIQGAISSSRFDFQKDWSLCKLLETHGNSNNYLFLFDYFEDLVILDSEENPQKANFYQIKGKRANNWTLRSLLKRKDSENSIIGKLYSCKIMFDSSVESLNFVSNALYNLTLKDRSNSISKDLISIDELGNSEKIKIINQLIEEFELKTQPNVDELFFFKVVELNLNESSTHVKGKLVEFLNQIIPEEKFDIETIYNVLFNEIKKKTNYNKDLHSFDELVKNKGIGKNEFAKIITQITQIKDDYSLKWNNIDTELRNNNYSFSDRLKIKNCWNKLETDLMNPNNDLIFSTIKNLKKKYQILKSKGKTKKLELKDYINYFKTSVLKPSKMLINDDYFTALILFVIYE